MTVQMSPPLSDNLRASQQTHHDFCKLDLAACRKLWRKSFRHTPHKDLSVSFMRRVLSYEAQRKAFGGLPTDVKRAFKRLSKRVHSDTRGTVSLSLAPKLASSLSPGTQLVREWNGRTYQVEVAEDGFVLDGRTYKSLSAIAKKITGTQWSGPRFFGLQKR
ncbi:DUF2924 domain-containing protein [Maritalea porphyrae]|jgi:hypothetical protein|uniref:DUF2924 domain-containing protein n=1 Tax=Maritalea porphyrae TaxID=880732 RepID=UPI0022AEC993|nr:DUF2924 domain-containing protein [Maritalea porphyrae]MCZ4271304.1 DUF2924 domain-containing protein [Maritalea porphyrae]